MNNPYPALGIAFFLLMAMTLAGIMGRRHYGFFGPWIFIFTGKVNKPKPKQKKPHPDQPTSSPEHS